MIRKIFEDCKLKEGNIGTSFNISLFSVYKKKFLFAFLVLFAVDCLSTAPRFVLTASQLIHSLLEHEVSLAPKSCLMQPFRKERQNKPYRCTHCPKSFKSSNGLKYHSEKVHLDEETKMDVCSGNGIEGIYVYFIHLHETRLCCS